MAKIFGFLLLFAQVSLQQKDPLIDFCRRFGHQSCVIDSRLYIDGGQVNWNPILANRANYSNTFESYHDLNTSPAGVGVPQLHASLSKNATIPDWPDAVNKRFFLFGGDTYGTPPSASNLLSYDTVYDKWDSFGTPSQGIQSVSWGAGTGISDIGQGFVLGGWLSNSSVPGWSGDPFATNSLLTYDMDKNFWTNSTGPADNVARAEGVMVWLPASDSGVLVQFGGVTVDSNGTMEASPMEKINVYDVKSGKWYTQTASGNVPATRRKFCAGAAWAPDRSSYNIYLYGGLGFGANGPGFDDVYILSLPSFTWILYYEGGTGGFPHNSLTCNVVGGQMLITGGTFPLSDACDSPSTWGMHVLDMGKVSGKQWNPYVVNLTDYVVPPEIISVVGGSSLGGATNTTPVSGFDNNDLRVYFTQRASIAARTPTRAIPVATQSSSSSPSANSSSGIKLSGSAIAGIAVGGGLFLSTLIFGVCFLFRHKRSKKTPPPPLSISKATPEYYQGPFTPFTPQSQVSPAGMFKPTPHYQLPATPEPVELYGSHPKGAPSSEVYHDVRQSDHPAYRGSKPSPSHEAGSPDSIHSDSGTNFGGSIAMSPTLYGSPPTPVYGKSPPRIPLPIPPPNHF